MLAQFSETISRSSFANSKRRVICGKSSNVAIADLRTSSSHPTALSRRFPERVFARCASADRWSLRGFGKALAALSLFAGSHELHTDLPLRTPDNAAVAIYGTVTGKNDRELVRHIIGRGYQRQFGMHRGALSGTEATVSTSWKR